MILGSTVVIKGGITFPRIGGGDPKMEYALTKGHLTFPRIGGGDPHADMLCIV